jgi:hypothetical protein
MHGDNWVAIGPADVIEIKIDICVPRIYYICFAAYAASTTSALAHTQFGQGDDNQLRTNKVRE